jgi:hypothetical protein
MRATACACARTRGKPAHRGTGAGPERALRQGPFPQSQGPAAGHLQPKAPRHRFLPAARAGALSRLVERRPWLLRPILAQLLPPARAIDPAERLGISIRSLHDAAEFQRALQTVCAAVSAGEIGIREAGHIARQVRTRMRALRRLARLRRRALRLANKANPLRPPLG